jgi:polyhydroxybutyrate depolymerase
VRPNDDSRESSLPRPPTEADTDSAADRPIADHDRIQLQTGGLSRDAWLLPPAGSTPAPLVLMFHGGGGSAEIAMRSTRWSQHAAEAGFAVAYPQATRLTPQKPIRMLSNPTFWNVGSGFGHAERRGIDDVAFVTALLDQVQANYAIDATRIFFCGFSNGAAMALRAAVELCERVRAVAAVAGHLWRRDRPLRRRVPLLYLCGGADKIVPPAGGLVPTLWGKPVDLPPVRQTVETWAAWLHCDPPRSVPSPDGIERLVYPLPDAATPGVEFVTLADAGHVWPGGVSVMNERLTGPASNALDATAECRRFFGI